MSLRQVIVEIPEKILITEKKTEKDFAIEMRILTAVKLFEMGRLSSGAAAELANMSTIEFLTNLGNYKVFPFTSELEELESNA